MAQREAFLDQLSSTARNELLVDLLYWTGLSAREAYRNNQDPADSRLTFLEFHNELALTITEVLRASLHGDSELAHHRDDEFVTSLEEIARDHRLGGRLGWIITQAMGGNTASL